MFATLLRSLGKEVDHGEGCASHGVDTRRPKTQPSIQKPKERTDQKMRRTACRCYATSTSAPSPSHWGASSGAGSRSRPAPTSIVGEFGLKHGKNMDNAKNHSTFASILQHKTVKLGEGLSSWSQSKALAKILVPAPPANPFSRWLRSTSMACQRPRSESWLLKLVKRSSPSNQQSNKWGWWCCPTKPSHFTPNNICIARCTSIHTWVMTTLTCWRHCINWSSTSEAFEHLLRGITVCIPGGTDVACTGHGSLQWLQQWLQDISGATSITTGVFNSFHGQLGRRRIQCLQDFEWSRGGAW